MAWHAHAQLRRRALRIHEVFFPPLLLATEPCIGTRVQQSFSTSLSLTHPAFVTAEFPTPSPSSWIPPFHLRRFLRSCAVSALLLHSLRCFLLSYAYAGMGLVTSGSICQVSMQFRAIFPHVITRSRPHTSRSRSRSLPTRAFVHMAAPSCPYSSLHRLSLSPGIPVVWVVDPMHGNTVQTIRSLPSLCNHHVTRP